MRVSATVTNTGQRGGREVVQVYVTDPQCSVFRPEAELKGCAVVSLEPGQSGRVDISLDARAFSFWHPTLGRWVIEGGRFGIRVGSSSRDIRLTTEVELAGEPAAAPLTPEMPTAMWLDHPVAGPLVRRLLKDDPEYDEDRMRRLRGNPFDRVSRMRGFPIPEADLSTLAAEANAVG